MVGGHRPIEDRKEGQFVLFKINAGGQVGLHRGAEIERVRQADQPGAGDLVNVAVAGQHMGQRHLRGRAYGKAFGVILLRVAHLRGDGQPQGQRQAASGAAQQQPRKGERGQHIGHEQEDGEAQKRPGEWLFRRQGKAAQRHIGGPCGGGEGGLAGQHIARKTPFFGAVDAGRQGGACGGRD